MKKLHLVIYKTVYESQHSSTCVSSMRKYDGETSV